MSPTLRPQAAAASGGRHYKCIDKVISLQRSSVQSSVAFSESISTVNLSFSTIRNIFDRLLARVAGLSPAGESKAHHDHYHDRGSPAGKVGPKPEVKPNYRE